LQSTSAAPKPILSSTQLVIGARHGGLIDRFVGVLDEVAIYDHALSAGRVKAHWDAGTTK
jgi:hypothetical protein